VAKVYLVIGKPGEAGVRVELEEGKPVQVPEGHWVRVWREGDDELPVLTPHLPSGPVESSP
jgi:hypothetical protein